MAGATAGAARAGGTHADGRRVIRAHRRSQAHDRRSQAVRRTKEGDRRVERERTEDDGAQEDRREEACAQADRAEEDRRAQARRAQDDDRTQEDGDAQDRLEPGEEADPPAPVTAARLAKRNTPAVRRSGCLFTDSAGFWL